MRILILSTSFSGLCQRVQRELILLGHVVDEHYDLRPRALAEQIAAFGPDLVLCPFLTQRIPDDIWQNYLCLVVHPGVEGDRGPSSLDWAIIQGAGFWGTTLLQADKEMDMGDVWSTKQFPMRRASKTSIYKREVTALTVQMIKEALVAIGAKEKISHPLDYGNSNVVGTLQPLMKQNVRSIQWSTDTTQAVIAKLNAADTTPGVKGELFGYEMFYYGAIPEVQLTGAPGQALAVANGSVCIATTDGAVWIRQLKHKHHDALPPIKLPASMVLSTLLMPRVFGSLVVSDELSAANDIVIERQGDVAYVFFDFYNGAANTQQCQKLKAELMALKNSDAKCIVFMGGEDFWSNGIHLNCIEAAANPAKESWLNINAIDDVVLEMINCPNQLTIAALRNNAGAGGAMMALACDQVLIRDGVVLNPHYQTMGLFGSEYWTYLLPKRIGQEAAQQVTTLCKPILAVEAFNLGMADEIFPEEWTQYDQLLKEFCQDQIADQDRFNALLQNKAQQRAADENAKPLAKYRKEELALMKQTFDNPNSSYHSKRQAFVYKLKPQVQAKNVKAADHNDIRTSSAV